MAQAKLEVIEALRRTAKKLDAGTQYMWGHMGSCNCGNLAQEITKRSKAEIHAYAMQGHGDWNEQLNDYCGTTQMPIDLVIHEMLTSGFELADLQNLEKLLPSFSQVPSVSPPVSTSTSQFSVHQKDTTVIMI